MRNYPFFALLCWMFFNVLTTNAIDYGISNIEYFNRRQYGGATQNWSVTQADNGLLYFANNNGIIEFDGTSWRILPRHTSLLNNIPRSVLADQGKIYIGATDEFGFYEEDSTGNFEYYSLSDKYNLDDLGDYWNIFPLNDQFIFQSHNALCIYTPGESVEVVEAVSRISESFLVNGMILLGDDEEGLMELRQGALYRIPGGEVFAGKTISTIMAVSGTEIIIGTIDDGLFKWDQDGIERWDAAASHFLDDVNVFCGTNIGEDMAIGTIQSGVVIVDKDGNIKMIAGKDKGLYNNTVLDIFVDSQKNIWTGLDNGIARLSYNSAVSFIEGYFDIGTGYCMNKESSNFYFGTNQALYTISEEAFRNPRKSRSDFHMVKGTNGQVWSLFKDDYSDELLMGHNLGIYSVNGETAELISPSSLNGAWDFKYVPGNKDLLMVGTYTGLVLLKRTEQNSWEYFSRVDGFYESARFFEWTDNGDLWVAHGLKGLYKLQFNESHTRVTSIERNADFEGLTKFDGFSLSSINDRIVFTNTNGIFSLNDKTIFVHDELESFFEDEENYPVQLRQDRFGNIWFFVDNGVGVLRHQEDGTYIKIDNPLVPLKNKLVNGFESVFVLNNETAFFGIEDGFGQYSVNNDINYFQPFDAHIRGFGSQSRQDERFFISSNNQPQAYVPVFSFDENDFEVFYSATWFGSGQVEYSTILEGFDNQWSSWGTIQNRQFTRLTEGEYVFKVKARNIHGVQSKPAVFHFEVLPPWYRTTTANIVYTILIIIMLVLIWWITSRIIEKSKQKEKLREREKFQEREELLRREALENEKEMVRLRNEKLQNDMKHKEKELANSTMHIIRKNDFLIQIKDELQKARKYRDNQMVEKKIASVVRQIDRDIDNEAHWEIFETHLEQVHEDFLKRLTRDHKNLTAREMRLAAYLRMNMSSKEIASLMNITPRAVENNRYKLRKKLGLEQGSNLVDYIMKI